MNDERRHARDNDNSGYVRYGSARKGSLSDERGKRYILQKINHNVFRDVEGLMRNIVGVTEYIAKRTEESNERLEVIPTAEGKPYLVYKGGYYRMYNFIYGGVSIESRPSTDEMRISGMGFGRFQKLTR